MGASITKITDNKKRYLDLLLLGDEQESMIDRYLERGEMFVLEDDGVKAVCVVTGESREVCELKNIAGFFTQNYDHPIIDNGVLLKDMIYLKRKI